MALALVCIVHPLDPLQYNANRADKVSQRWRIRNRAPYRRRSEMDCPPLKVTP